MSSFEVVARIYKNYAPPLSIPQQSLLWYGPDQDVQQSITPENYLQNSFQANIKATGDSGPLSETIKTESCSVYGTVWFRNWEIRLKPRTKDYPTKTAISALIGCLCFIVIEATLSDPFLMPAWTVWNKIVPIRGENEVLRGEIAELRVQRTQ